MVGRGLEKLFLNVYCNIRAFELTNDNHRSEEEAVDEGERAKVQEIEDLGDDDLK